MRNLLAVLIISIALSIALFLVSKRTFFFTGALGDPANLVVDLGATYEENAGNWRNLAQGGEEKGEMLVSVLEKIKSLRPEYIRIDHIYDFYDVVSKDPSGNINFNWSKLDLTLNDIQAVGATPFISISYTPPAISSGDIIDLPASWQDWEVVVQKTIEHISRKQGGASNVYYEVWNEPDLFGKFKIGGEKNYLDLYSHSAIGASRAKNVQPFKFGGPATTALYKNWFDSFFKFASKNNLRVDFYSWHRYSKNLDDFETDILNAQTWVIPFAKYKNVEFVFSEMGPNSENDKVYDNFFGAIHAIATSVVLENDARRGFLFEIKDGPGPEKYWGRWGLLTHEKWGAPEEKPRYKALQFLNRMVGGRLNVAGEGSWVKAFGKKKDKTSRILIINYDPNGKHFETIPITFLNLPDQTFNYRRIDFSGKIKELEIATDSATWVASELFEPNSAAILEIVETK